MFNPWTQIPRGAPFVLEIDRLQVDNFNRSVAPKYQLHLEILPQPFAGTPKTAGVYLLSLNPGFSEKDEYYQSSLESFRLANEHALNLSSNSFFFLDQRFSETPAYAWWSKHLKEVVAVWGIEKTLKKLMVIEFFPYHSRSYKPMKEQLPSQTYSLELVKQAIANKKHIIIMRNEKLWLKHIPELKNYPYTTLINKQRAWISKNNLPPKEEIFNK
jgi:hypothetical protein